MNFRALAGRGVSGAIEGRSVMMGARRLVVENGLTDPILEPKAAQLEGSGRTVSWLAETAPGKRVLGMVAFVNATTISNLDQDERLFDSVAVGAGAGLRLSINKRSKTNLCFDVGFGKNGSKGVYLSIQEAF